MDILKKIQRDGIEHIQRIHSKIGKMYSHGCPYNGFFDFTRAIQVFAQDLKYYDGSHNFPYVKYLLRLEMSNLSKLKMFAKGERKRINKMVANEGMVELAMVIINKKRNDRLKKYGRETRV